MQTKNKPSGWLKLFLVLSISCGILITLYSLLWLANDLPIGIGFLCCGTFMTIFGCCAWSAYKKGLPKALSFSKGCIATFFILIIFVFCYRFLDGMIYDKGSYSSGFIIFVLLFTGMWCGAWLLFLLKSQQVKRLVAGSASGGSKIVKTSIAILVIGLIVSSATFYIKESNVHHAREMRYLADQLKAAHEGLVDFEEDIEEDEEASTGDYSVRNYQTAKATNKASTPKRKTVPETSNEVNSSSNSNAGYKRMDVGVATISIPASFTFRYDKDDDDDVVYTITRGSTSTCVVLIFPYMDAVCRYLMNTIELSTDYQETVVKSLIDTELSSFESVKIVDHKFYQSKGRDILCVTTEVVDDGIKRFVKLYLIREGKCECTVLVEYVSGSEPKEAKQIVESIKFK